MEFSPDSQWIAYDISQATLHVARVDGSERRQLAARAGEKEWLEVSGWSADGTQVMADATSSDDSHANRAFALNARTGAVTAIAALPAIAKQTWFWLSPDGRYFAQRKGTEPKSVTLLDLKTNREETISESDGERAVGWTPDGSRLVYTRARQDTIDLWSRLVSEGKPVGEPELVWGNLGHVMPLGITRDGNIYYYIRPAKNGPNPTDFATLWVMEGFLARAIVPPPPARRSTSIPVAEVIGPKGVFLDPKSGFTAAPPSGLHLDAAFRRPSDPYQIIGGSFRFEGDKDSEVRVAFHYREPGPVPNPKDPAALRAAVESEFGGVQTQFGAADYSIRPGTLAVRTVDGRPALSWVADFTRNGQKGVHVMTGIYYDHGLGFVWLTCAAAKADNLRPIYDDLLKTVRLPPAPAPVR